MDAATIATIAYADVFDYPLTSEELRRWLLVGGRMPKNTQEWYYLPGRKNLIALRKKRMRHQAEKWHVARRAAAIISKIPTVLCIGVTGGLAMNNAKREDDIDLCIITAPGYLWTTRLFATLILDIFRLRRRPNERNVKNKVCLNMFMSGGLIPSSERDLFSAHEVLQMEPLMDRGGVYRRFLRANKWVSRYLPNAWRYRYGN